MKRLTLLATCMALFSLTCQKAQPPDDIKYELGYRDYVQSGNFVNIHGETVDTTRLGDDKYLEDNLDFVLGRNEWVLVNFSAYWCKDCRRFDPDYKAIAGMPEYKDVIFAQAEVDGTKGNENFRARFKLPGVPVTILFHRGEIPDLNGQPAILFGQRGDKTKGDLLALLKAFYRP
ncbi:MAG: thioredoxin family protein [candidate division Zixibacteria bacterium]|nr:thioredoxin family protein [candidate division Zixibacteria bacterium]